MLRLRGVVLYSIILGFEAPALRSAGLECSQLRSAGFTAEQCSMAGYSLKELGVFGARVLLDTFPEWDIPELKEAGFDNPRELRELGYRCGPRSLLFRKRKDTECKATALLNLLLLR